MYSNEVRTCLQMKIMVTQTGRGRQQGQAIRSDGRTDEEINGSEAGLDKQGLTLVCARMHRGEYGDAPNCGIQGREETTPLILMTADKRELNNARSLSQLL